MSGPRNATTRDASMWKLSTQMATLKEERSSLVLKIGGIDQKLSELRAEYGAIYNASSSLLNLPAEITCMIFDYATATATGTHPEYNDLDTEPAPETAEGRRLRSEVVITHVCKRWREIALNYPRLWSRFFYWEEDMSGDGISLQRFAAYLDRSGTQSLELVLEFNDSFAGPRTNPVEEDDRLAMLDLALTHVARWKIFILRADFSLPVIGRIRSLTSATAPNLEYFAFSPDVSGQKSHFVDATDLIDAPDIQPTLFTGGAPKLDYVHLDGSGCVLPPLSNITTLRIEAEDCLSLLFTWPAMLEIFAIPTLTNLSIVGNVFHPPLAFEGLPLITMSSLKHLRYSDNDFLTLLLPYLRLPVLESLSLRNIWVPEEFGTTVPTPPPTSSKPGYFFPSLTTVTLIDSTASTIAAARYFMHLTKRTQTLLLSVDEPDENILAVLLPYSPHKECWPKLSTLIANLNSEDEIEFVIELAVSRPKKALRLKMFEELERAWRMEEPEQFARLEAACTLDTLGNEDQEMLKPVWPPGGRYPGYSNNDDPFEVDTDYPSRF
ncbi:hypothetical protein CVT25_011650 [Psilocybe cyanescens]|uniref:Uncharacterized protein n=1 Tax=Psilocybe cyanescens TaxID=93625 RepID=A0A409WIL6_PSICY|nr:hypothetical protein CVT25_011650 [Psilocybe cyanescens]